MPQSLAQIYLHLIFSTKDREALLVDKAFRERVHAYLAGTCRSTRVQPSSLAGLPTMCIS